MTSNEPAAYRPPLLRPFRKLRPGRVFQPLESVGHQFLFTVQSVRGCVHAARFYRKQTSEIFTDLVWGQKGRVIIDGGIVAVLVVMGIAAGAMIGIVGYTTLNTLGMGPLAGLLSAFANTRELAPLIAAVGFAAQVGCRMTAEIGSMRISEEIDALEAQAIRPIPFVVSTRLIAGLLTVIPTYLIALTLSYVSASLVVTGIQGQAAGAFSHYFHMFIEPRDIVYSLIKVVFFIIVVTITHAYHGFYASGGPAGVGIAAGKAVRSSLILVVLLDMVLTIVMWGFNSPISFSG